MPDVFIPIDTVGVTDYLVNVRNRGLIYRFALQYTEQNRKELEKTTNLVEINSYLDKKNAFNQFIAFASQNNVPPNKKEIAVSKKILKTQLYAYIIRNIFDNQGYYPAIEPIDNTLLKAIDILSEKNSYAKN